MMMTQKRVVLFALMILICGTAFGSTAVSEERSKRHGPPPEAYSCCEGKNAGDTASFENPRGETVTGTCEAEGDRMVLRPDRRKGQSDRKHQGPPPEAYTACQGKGIGNEASFENPRGETITGTCELEGDRLVLRPDHPRGSRPDDAMETHE